MKKVGWLFFKGYYFVAAKMASRVCDYDIENDRYRCKVSAIVLLQLNLFSQSHIYRVVDKVFTTLHCKAERKRANQ